MRLTGKSRLRWLALAFIVVLLLAHPFVLRGLGRFLVKADAPERADAAVVLAGDFTGGRLRAAIELVRANYVPMVVVSGPCCIYGQNEGQMAIDMVIREGAPRELFALVANNARSTREESAAVLNFLRRRGASSFLLITSDYHTRRAGSIYREAAGGLRFSVVSVPGQDFRADRWWRSRQGQKVFLGEWQKTVANWLGI